MKRNKYGAVPTVYNERRYASKREAARAAELDLLVKARKVHSWTAQPRFKLIVDGEIVCTYVADFWVVPMSGDEWIEDVKGVIAPHSKIKMALYNALRNRNEWPELRIVK